MEAIKDLIFGVPVYDRRGRVVRRNFGIKNALVIILIVYGLYSLRGKMGIKSGRRKLRGGGSEVGGEVGRVSSNEQGPDLWSIYGWWWCCYFLCAFCVFSVVVCILAVIILLGLSLF